MIASSEGRGRKAVLPEVVGLPSGDARSALALAGFDNTRLKYVEAYADERTVVEQDPPGGRLVDDDAEIHLSVARENLVAFLPGVYHQRDEDGGSFLRGFLYIVQQILDDVTGSIDGIHRLFDPRSTEPEFLPWLAGWLSITLDPDWNDLQRRKMLRAATRLFPRRGTVGAVEEFVRIYTGSDVTIRENAWPFGGFRVGVNSTIGQDTVILPTMNLAHCFVVQLGRAAVDVREAEIIKIHRIIQAQKPAHTSYFLAFADETEAGTMGVFLEVGAATIGVEQGSEPVSEPPPEPTPTPPRAASSKAKESPGGGKTKKKKTAKGKTSKKTKTT